MTLSRTPRRKADANWTPRSDALKGLLLGRTPSPSPAHCAWPGPRGILGHKLSPRLPRTFYDVGSESVSAPGPLFGKVTWTSTAMAEGEEVLPLPTPGGDGW
ncbi:hypothetical protein J1605_000301 [Eschrichtius robustus]|uniref:Uncharacterized protein n=1 Tax=Eschrichtius robustus TaxID=9764 RepID=A0AB34HNR9_ESCRO|nr:hypothetical protein J1605_000301 [Eschrichtius robustus]